MSLVKHPYGLVAAGQLSQLEVELQAFLLDPPQGLGKAEHFWNICEILWGSRNKAAKKKHFERNPWTDRMVDAACREQYLGLSGCSACVAGHTRLPNPITGEQPTFEELYGRKERPVVMTQLGPILAGVPFIKGEEELFTVTLSNGHQFSATPHHLVLSLNGYVPVSSLLPGSLLAGFALDLQATISDTSLLTHVQGAQNFPKKAPVAVQEIRSAGRQIFYDINVPYAHHYFAEGAIHHNSGKSEFAAVWAIINWLCAPTATLVFCTSTSLKDSQRRIWGRIKKFWQDSAFALPGKLVDSMYIIRTDDGSGVFSDETGICCIAGEKKNEKEAVGKLIGAHPKRLILIVDEMPEITEAILTAALSNMAINPWFQLIGIGNFKSIYDCFGVFVRPKDGYDSISIEDEEWDTELGLCLRFDGMKSPNITGGRDRYEGYNSKDLAAHRKNCGEDSAEFWRMCRSFHAPIGTSDVLYSEADLLDGKCSYSIPSEGLSWLGPRIHLSSLDPSYTNGGDRTIQWFFWWGILTNGIWTLCYDKYVLIRDEVSDKAPRDYQIVRKFRDNCIKEGVVPDNAAFDGTAASSFAAIMSEEWSPKVLKVEFGGAPSDRIVSAADPRIAKDLYDRRVSELWGVGREFMRAGQLKGMPTELCRELKARKYETSKRGGNVIIVVEEKKKMKSRIGFSPDIADAALVGLELVRRRHNALAGGIATGRRAAVSNFFKIAKEKDKVYPIFMPKQILDRRGVPRGNYDYLVTQTGHRIEAHVFGKLVTSVRAHMTANGVMPPKDLEAIIENDFCTRRPEYCHDTDAVKVTGEDAFTQVVAALAIPAADALAKVSKLFGINCKACNQRHQVIRRIKQVGVAETLRQLKGTFTSG